MKNAQKPDHASLTTIVNNLRDGRYVIPDFQREFEWQPWDISSLMCSIFLDYYIGSLLLWKGTEENFESLACETVSGFDGNLSKAEHIVLDGQQRLTAIYYAFFAPEQNLPTRKSRYLYFINVKDFMEDETDKAFFYDWGNKGLKYLENKDLQFEDHIFPISIMGLGGWELPNWAQDYQKYWEEKAKYAEENDESDKSAIAEKHVAIASRFGVVLKELSNDYQIAYIELDKDLEISKVCDIFTKINSKGIQLDVFDLINALLKPRGVQLKHMWRSAKERMEFIDSPKMNVYVLQVMSILTQNYCSPKYLYYLLPGQSRQLRNEDGTLRSEILISDTIEFKALWEKAVDSIEHAIKQLSHPQEYGVISSNYIPYVSIVPVFAAIQSFYSTLDPTKQLNARRKIKHWYWASVFTKRYSGSVESTSAKDFIDIQKWIANSDDEPALIQELENNFRNIDFKGETKSGTSVYNGIFNLLVIKGAMDWMTGNVPQHDDLDDHHIIPASWGKKHLKGDLVHTILNRTPLSANTNRNVIGKKLPNEYLPELIKSNGEKTVRAILESHFVSSIAFDILLRDPFTPEDFEEFIAERQRTLQDAIENLLIKERLDLSSSLRELDEQIEWIELYVRSLILDKLDSDVTLVPSGVLEKVNDRISSLIKKKSNLDPTTFETLEGKLEQFDLRELQSTILNKSLWERFDSCFGTKQELETKFDQLAELRNAIRHSRAVDEVTKKEGEAAIVWFKQILESKSICI